MLNPTPVSPAAPPQFVAISPSTGIAAWNYKGGASAWKLWVLTRALDVERKNYCRLAQIREALDQVGVSERTYFYWLRDAQKYGLIRIAHDNAYYMAEHKVARVFHAHPDERKAEIELQPLFKKGWKLEVWAGYIKGNHDGQKISRKKLCRLSGVSASRQRRIDRLITRQRNIAITEHGADRLPAYRDFTRKAAPFVFKDKGRGDRVAYHLPAKVQVSDTVARVGTVPRFHYTARHNSRTLSFSEQRRADGGHEIWRLFYEKEPNRLFQGAARLADPDEVFVRRGHRSGVQISDAVTAKR